MVKMSPPTNTQFFFTGQMPFLSPNQQCQSSEWKIFLETTRINENLPFYECQHLTGEPVPG